MRAASASLAISQGRSNTIKELSSFFIAASSLLKLIGTAAGAAIALASTLPQNAERNVA